MNPRNLRKTVVIMAFIVLFSTFTLAFGYMKGQETATVSPGGSTTFQFYVFGDNGSIEVQDIEQPADWQVDATPATITLPPEENFRYRQTSDGYQKIAPVNVAVDVPFDAVSGSHSVVVHMQQRTDEQTGYLNVQQVQDFDFTVTVDGGDPPTETSTEEENTTEQREGQLDNLTAVDANQGSAEGTQSSTGENATAQEEAGESKGIPWTTVGIVVFEILWVITVIYLVRERYF